MTPSLDPNAPKRGLSAYMFFANEQRDNVREENPGITFGKSSLLFLVWLSDPSRSNQLTPCLRATGQVGKVLGERWKALNMKQREPYEAKAATDKKRYEDEKASYNNVRTRVIDPSELLCYYGADHVSFRPPTMTKTRINSCLLLSLTTSRTRQRALPLMNVVGFPPSVARVMSPRLWVAGILVGRLGREGWFVVGGADEILGSLDPDHSYVMNVYG